jgi:hypothetical protein
MTWRASIVYEGKPYRHVVGSTRSGPANRGPFFDPTLVMSASTSIFARSAGAAAVQGPVHREQTVREHVRGTWLNNEAMARREHSEQTVREPRRRYHRRRRRRLFRARSCRRRRLRRARLAVHSAYTWCRTHGVRSTATTRLLDFKVLKHRSRKDGELEGGPPGRRKQGGAVQQLEALSGIGGMTKDTQ